MYDSPARYVSSDTKRKKGKKGCKGCGGAFSKTAKDYSGASSIHGFAYLFEAEHGTFLRVLWLLVVLLMASLGIYLSVQARTAITYFLN